MKKSKLLLIGMILLFVGAGAFILWRTRKDGKAPAKQLRVLAYVGYDEPDFIQPLEKALGAKIVVETYVGGEQMYTKFTQSPSGTYDIVVLDAEYGERLFADRRLIALDPTLWKFDDLFAKFQTGDPARAGNEVYAAVARWGAIGIVYNTKHIDQSRLASYQLLFDSDLRGRIGLYDWYLPNMGILSLSQGNKEPYNIDASQLTKLEQSLSMLRGQVTSIQPNPGQVLADLRSGNVWVAPGIGEWAAASLANDGLPIDWAVPKPGGIMWVEAFAISSDSKDLALSKQFLAEVMKPQNLALLATRKAYFSQVTRTSAYPYIPPTARKNLKADDLSALGLIADQLQFRHLPGPKTTEQDWIAVWTRFKAGR